MLFAIKKFALVLVAAVIIGHPLNAIARDDAMMGFDTPVKAKADFIGIRGESHGEAILDESENGVMIRLDLHGLPAGEHAIHIHETGDCAPFEQQGHDADPQNYFSNAGSHLNPAGKAHGMMHDEGMHPGDLPNIHVGTDGTAKVHFFNNMIMLRRDDKSLSQRVVLFDEDGAAIVVHEGTDDYESQPAGNAGHRIACAVIMPE